MKKLFEILIFLLYVAIIGTIIFVTYFIFFKNTDPWDTQDVDIKPITWDIWDLEIIEQEILDIDYVYSVIDWWNEKNFSIVTFPRQWTIAATQEWINSYLNNNLKFLKMPADIKSGYMYIELNTRLREIPNIDAYQPINIRGNTGIYWRLDTEASLPVYDYNREFLFPLNNIPVRNSSTTNRLDFRWQQIRISWVVSDTRWNYIKRIVFIWIR